MQLIAEDRDDHGDGSKGVHNPCLSVDLLAASLNVVAGCLRPERTAALRRRRRSWTSQQETPAGPELRVRSARADPALPTASHARLHRPRSGVQPRGRLAAGLRRPRPGHAHRAIHRFGRRRLAAARPAGSHRPVDLPEAGLGHGRRHRARRDRGARGRWSSLWRRRRAIWTWLVTRDRGVKLGLAGGGRRRAPADGGDRREGLRLHDARQRFLPRAATSSCPAARSSCDPTPGPTCWSTSWRGSTTASPVTPATRSSSKAQTKELYYWIMERPDKMPPHAKVPREICEQCHVQGAAKKTWQRIASTAGHRIHLESDSSALKDVACLTCHARIGPPLPAGRHDLRPEGLPPHRRGQDPARAAWPPGSSRENLDSQRGAALLQLLPPVHRGRPVRDPGLRRRRPPPGPAAVLRLPRDAHAPRDVRPGQGPARRKLRDVPQPHTDVKPADALKSCADAGCHANWRGVAFHAGKAHRKVARAVSYLPRSRTRPGWMRATVPGATPTVRKGGAGATAPAVRYPEGPATEHPAGGTPPDTTAPRVHSLVDPGRSRGRGDAPFPTSHPGASSPEPPLSPTPSPIEPIADSPASPATAPHRGRATSRSSRPVAARSAITSARRRRIAPPATRPRRSSRLEWSTSR